MKILLTILEFSFVILLILVIYAILKIKVIDKNTKTKRKVTAIVSEEKYLNLNNTNKSNIDKVTQIGEFDLKENVVEERESKNDTVSQPNVNYELIETEGKINKKDIESLETEINRTIPDWLLDSFISNGWRIVLSSEKNLASKYLEDKYVAAMAVTDYRDKKIIISKRAIQDSVAHEFGHFLDVTYPIRCSQTEEFKKIYQEEGKTFKKKIINSGCVINIVEFFAEEFYYSRVNPSKCTPKALEYIEKVSKDYKEGSHI